MVSYHYLIVQTLHSNFDPYGVIIEKVDPYEACLGVWLRYFSECFSLGNASK
jgi:hypothetical protein